MLALLHAGKNNMLALLCETLLWTWRQIAADLVHKLCKTAHQFSIGHGPMALRQPSNCHETLADAITSIEVKGLPSNLTNTLAQRWRPIQTPNLAVVRNMKKVNLKPTSGLLPMHWAFMKNGSWVTSRC